MGLVVFVASVWLDCHLIDGRLIKELIDERTGQLIDRVVALSTG